RSWFRRHGTHSVFSPSASLGRVRFDPTHPLILGSAACAAAGPRALPSCHSALCPAIVRRAARCLFRNTPPQVALLSLKRCPGGPHYLSVHKDGSQSMSPDTVIDRILDLSAEAQAKRREIPEDSPEFHKLTGAVLAYGKVLNLLTKLRAD